MRAGNRIVEPGAGSETIVQKDDLMSGQSGVDETGLTEHDLEVVVTVLTGRTPHPSE